MSLDEGMGQRSEGDGKASGTLEVNRQDKLFSQHPGHKALFFLQPLCLKGNN